MTPRPVLAAVVLGLALTGCIYPIDSPKLAGTRIGTPASVVDLTVDRVPPEIIVACTTPDHFPFTYYGPRESVPARCQVKS